MVHFYHIVVLLLSVTTICAQQLPLYEFSSDNHSTSSRMPTDSVLKMYESVTFNAKEFLNGREYKPYHHPQKSTPYLNSDYGTGDLYIDGRVYCNEMLYYDIKLDELILRTYQFPEVYIKLNKSLIDSFTIAFDQLEYHLVKMKFTDNCPFKLEDGFYENVYNGRFKYIVRHTVSTSKEDGYPVYNHIRRHYLSKDSCYYDVSSKKKFVNLFLEHRKAIRRKCKSMHTGYKKMSIHQMVNLIHFAESL